jgi:hypothetical protein
MKVKEAIKFLSSNYTPDTELLVEWWDKETVESYGISDPLTEDEWTEVVERMSDFELAMSMIADAAVEQAEDIIKNR